MKYLLLSILFLLFSQLFLAQKGGVIFYTNPPASDVKLDSNKVVTGKHYILDTGKYEVTVSREFYLTQKFNLNIISDSSITFRMNLERDPVHVKYLEDLAIYKRGNFFRVTLPSLLTAAFVSTYLVSMNKGQHSLDELEYDVLSAKQAYEINVFPDQYAPLKQDFLRLQNDYSQKVNQVNAIKIGGLFVIAGSSFFVVRGIVKSIKTDKPIFDNQTSHFSLTPYYQLSSNMVGFNFFINL